MTGNLTFYHPCLLFSIKQCLPNCKFQGILHSTKQLYRTDKAVLSSQPLLLLFLTCLPYVWHNKVLNYRCHFPASTHGLTNQELAVPVWLWKAGLASAYFSALSCLSLSGMQRHRLGTHALQVPPFWTTGSSRGKAPQH